MTSHFPPFILPFRASTEASPLRFYFCLLPFIRVIRAIRVIRDPPFILPFRASTEASPLRFYFCIFHPRLSVVICGCSSILPC